ncbi:MULTISPECIES: NAD-binding protein [Sporosarcina]|uniref:NAD-binding protein n=1 Tax=Sporosarcina TaxID=1569 RepID=UPI000A17CB99|nr:MULTISPECIES: NAD-binding protein [Sporosarcina]ARK22760.1 hypothetical protein SporoP32a_15145 [Sporosarcina ureae]PIC75255.1 hypothetical protein CSV76_01215 [Sporosarcina sp. P17b]
MTKWLVVGTDQRLRIANELLVESGIDSVYISTDTFDDQLKKILLETKPDCLLLPLLSMKQSIPVDYLKEGSSVYSGNTSAVWRQELVEKSIRHTNYLEKEQFIWRNAQLTAEAFVHIFYEQTKRQIAGKHFYIAGFGRVGKAIAHTLHQLQATVTVVARSEEQLAEAGVLGYNTLQLNETTMFTNGYLVNTVPAQWLDIKQSGSVPVFDVSSAPGCLKQGDSSEYYTIHLKLPGKHFPKDAAAVLVDAVLRMSIDERGTKCSKENESD